MPTIMTLFCQEQVLDKEWILQWKAGEHDEILSEHCLWEKELDVGFKEKVDSFLTYLQEGGMDESSDDSDDDSEEDN